MPIQLTPQQETLRQNLEADVNTLTSHFNDTAPLNGSQVQAILVRMGQVGHQLHMSLSPHPKHHAYMIENRRMPTTDPRFYEHYHPCQDLLAYLEDPSANDDPIDHTMGDSFDLKVWSNRFGHYDKYLLTRNQDGWEVQFMSHQGQGDKGGEPALQHALTHDSISYPRTLDSKMSTIWEQAKNLGLTHDEVQDAINQVAHWISETERNEPTDGIFQY